MIKVSIFVLILFLVSAGPVFGCSCGNTSISEMFENSSAVVVAEAVEVKPAIAYLDFVTYENEKDRVGKRERQAVPGQEITIEVSSWFKGKNQNRILKLTQPNTTCDWDFARNDLKKTLLLYLSFNETDKTYKIITCGRSASVKRAADDLAWLKALPGSLNRTRISGVVRLNDDDNLFPGVGGIKISITGNGRKYDVISDKNGLYEIWDLPAGKYSISAEIPEDKKLGWTNSVPENWTYYWGYEDKPDYKALDVTLNPKSTAGIDFMLKNK